MRGASRALPQLSPWRRGPTKCCCPLGAAARCRSISSDPSGGAPNPRHGMMGHMAARALHQLDQRPALLIEQLQALATEASEGNRAATWPAECRSENDMKRDVDGCVTRLAGLVPQMDLRQISKTLDSLKTATWLDSGLLRAAAIRAVEILEGPTVKLRQRPTGLDELLSLFAYFGREPLGEELRLVEVVMRVADEMDLKNTRTITRLARAAAILGRPELADGRVGRLSMEQIDSLAGNQKMSGMDDDREMALSTLQQWFLGRRTSCYLAALCHVFTKSRRTMQAEMEALAAAAQQAECLMSARLKHQPASVLQTFVTRAAINAERDFASNAFALRPELADPAQVSEHVLDSGISIDCAFPGYLLAIEADGPAHFFWNKKEAPNGRTVFKRELLRAEGWLAVSITTTDWDVLRDLDGRRRFDEEMALIARRVREEDEIFDHSSSAPFLRLKNKREVAVFGTSTEEYQKRRPVQAEMVVEEKPDQERLDVAQIFAAGRQEQQTEVSAATKLKAERQRQGEEKRRERLRRAEKNDRLVKQRAERIAAKEKKQLRAESKAEQRQAQLLDQQLLVKSLEADFASSIERDWSWESDCLKSPIEHDGVPVYVLGVSSDHPGSPTQLWAVLKEVGWDNAQVVFGVGRAEHMHMEPEEQVQKRSVWHDCCTRTVSEAKSAKRRAHDAANMHPKGSINRIRAQQEVQGMQEPRFWCCAPSVIDLGEPWLEARAPSQADQSEWSEGLKQQRKSQSAAAFAALVFGAFGPPEEKLGDDAKVLYTLRELAAQRRQRTVDDAVQVYRRYEAEHAGEGASEGSLLALVQAAARSGSIDGGEPADAAKDCIVRLAEAGVSVEDSRREQQLRDLQLELLEKSQFPNSLRHRAATAGHIAAAVQEVVIPEVKRAALELAGRQQRGKEKNEGEAPAIVVVVEEGDYHSMRQLMADADAWNDPQPLPVRCEPRASALQQLLDVGVRPHVRALETVLNTPGFREMWKEQMSSSYAELKQKGSLDSQEMQAEIKTSHENIDRVIDDGPLFIQEAFAINEQGVLRDDCYPPTRREAQADPSLAWRGRGPHDTHSLGVWMAPSEISLYKRSAGWLQLPRSNKTRPDARSLLRDHYRLPHK